MNHQVILKMAQVLGLATVLVFASTQHNIALSDEHGHSEDEHGEHHDEESEEAGSSVGPDQAITAASRKDGIELTEKAIQTIGVKTAPLASASRLQVPKKALVYFQGEAGVYRLRGKKFKLVEVKIVNTAKDQTAIVTSDELKAGDLIVTEGVALLRVAELEAFGGSGDGHGH